ncbi:acylneuraminate cytidylyltransferase family protein [Planktomarina temperata]|nr:acylneuraminate cytidylyltransferase family protein [Planktomarina temperata]
MTNGLNQCVALLPMKANSQRVKGKNFKLINGKPLFKWILDTLLSVPEISKVVINTDARDILEQNGLTDSGRVKIRDRKPELCGDHISMNSILADDIVEVEATTYLMTHTTNPLLSAKTIQNSLEKYSIGVANGDCDSLFTVNKIQSRFYRRDGSAVNHDPNNLIQTQDLEPWYEENSNLYLFSAESFNTTNARIGVKPLLYVMNKLEVSDIDTPEDWELVRALLSTH